MIPAIARSLNTITSLGNLGDQLGIYIQQQNLNNKETKEQVKNVFNHLFQNPDLDQLIQFFDKLKESKLTKDNKINEENYQKIGLYLQCAMLSLEYRIKESEKFEKLKENLDKEFGKIRRINSPQILIFPESYKPKINKLRKTVESDEEPDKSKYYTNSVQNNDGKKLNPVRIDLYQQFFSEYGHDLTEIADAIEGHAICYITLSVMKIGNMHAEHWEPFDSIRTNINKMLQAMYLVPDFCKEMRDLEEQFRNESKINFDLSVVVSDLKSNCPDGELRLKLNKKNNKIFYKTHLTSGQIEIENNTILYEALYKALSSSDIGEDRLLNLDSQSKKLLFDRASEESHIIRDNQCFFKITEDDSCVTNVQGTELLWDLYTNCMTNFTFSEAASGLKKGTSDPVSFINSGGMDGFSQYLKDSFEESERQGIITEYIRKSRNQEFQNSKNISTVEQKEENRDLNENSDNRMPVLTAETMTENANQPMVIAQILKEYVENVHYVSNRLSIIYTAEDIQYKEKIRKAEEDIKNTVSGTKEHSDAKKVRFILLACQGMRIPYQHIQDVQINGIIQDISQDDNYSVTSNDEVVLDAMILGLKNLKLDKEIFTEDFGLALESIQKKKDYDEISYDSLESYNDSNTLANEEQFEEKVTEDHHGISHNNVELDSNARKRKHKTEDMERANHLIELFSQHSGGREDYYKNLFKDICYAADDNPDYFSGEERALIVVWKTFQKDENPEFIDKFCSSIAVSNLCMKYLNAVSKGELSFRIESNIVANDVNNNDKKFSFENSNHFR